MDRPRQLSRGRKRNFRFVGKGSGCGSECKSWNVDWKRPSWYGIEFYPGDGNKIMCLSTNKQDWCKITKKNILAFYYYLMEYYSKKRYDTQINLLFS